MLPIEKTARRLIGVLVQHFPQGGVCEDLRRAFEQDTSLRRQSFYNALNHRKKQGWLIGGARVVDGVRDRRDLNQLYTLNPDGSWRPPESIGEPVGEPRSRDQLEFPADSRAQEIGELQGEVERLRDWSSGSNDGADIALSSLTRIVSDGTASPRQRIKAAGAVLGYRVRDDSAVEFVKRFLQSVCVSTDIATDYRIEAGELLRRHEAPRIASESVRPSYSDDGGTEANRIEAWRTYQRWQLKKEIVLETRDPPKPGWDLELMAESYQPPAGGWPPVRVVSDPTSGFRLLESLLPRPGQRKGNGNGGDDSGASGG